MGRALALATRGWGRVAPNPLVGAVVVREGRTVGEGYHREYGKPHAEVEALRAAGEAARGATLYVTLEPCAHHGKTPPCTDAIMAAGVRRVVFALYDPSPAAGGGAEILRRAGLDVDGGVEAEAASDLNAPFFHAFTAAGSARPWIQLKLALSVDARLADREGRSTWITSEMAREEVQRLRAACDAIAVGIGTVLADNPRLTARGAIMPRRPPVRVVFDRALRLPPESFLAQTAREVPVWIVCGSEPASDRRHALEGLGVRILQAADMETALAALREAGVASLFCEGGASLAGALLRAEVVDRLALFYAPLFLGPEGRSPFMALESPVMADLGRWRHLSSASFGPDTLITLAR